MNEFDQLFFKIWRNKYLNSYIWKLVKYFSFEKIGEAVLGYNEMMDARCFMELNGIQVLKEKVYRKEFIHFPMKLKAEFFFYTRFLDQDFFKTMIENYRIQLISQRNIFQYIIRSGNSNALQVFLNEPSSLTRDALDDRPLPKWEFPRNKQLGDWAINSGYLSILKCLKENNEISVTTGERLFDNFIAMHSRCEAINYDDDGIDKVVDGEGPKSIVNVFNYCFDNQFFTLEDFKGTKLKVYDLFSYRFSHSLETLEFIYDIKEYISFNKSKSMNQFLTVDLFQYSFRKAILILNFYNYLNSLPNKSTIAPPFIEYSHSDFNIDQPNLVIKECKLKSVKIIKKFIEIGLRDYSNNNNRMIFMYMAYCGQVNEAMELMEQRSINQTSLYEYACQFCDLSTLKQLTNATHYFGSFSLFSHTNSQTSIGEKIKFLDYAVTKHPKTMTAHNWFPLFQSLIFSNQVELVQYLLDNHNDYFEKPEIYQESYRKFTNDKALLIRGFESYKLVFKYLAEQYAKQILICLIEKVYGSNESAFKVMDWIIQQKNSETDQFYIDKTDPIYIDSIDVNSYSDDIGMLKYLTENGFACTYKGIYSKVISYQRFNSFRYLFENRSEPIDISSPLLSECNLWFKLVYYLDIKCNGEFKEQYLKKFPISSHPLVEPDCLFIYYYQTNQMDKFLKHLDFKLTPNDDGSSGSNMDENYKDWESFCEDVRFLSNYFIDDIFSILLKYLDFKYSIKKISYFINPLIYSLVLDSNLQAIQFIFKKWPQIFNDENKETFDHAKLISDSLGGSGATEIFNFFYNVVGIPLPSYEGQSFEDMVSVVGIESQILFFLYYSFPNFKFKLPYKNNDEEAETWKVDWFFQHVLKNPPSQIKPEGSDGSGSDRDIDDGDTTEEEDK